jgi:hypothetical protein
MHVIVDTDLDHIVADLLIVFFDVPPSFLLDPKRVELC